MKVGHLNEMVKGWVAGAFAPTMLHTDACEFAVKRYVAGEREDVHFHKVATEITVVVSGRVRMVGREFGPDDIVVLHPGDVTAFEAITDAVTAVLKTPGALNDKYLVSEQP